MKNTNKLTASMLIGIIVAGESIPSLVEVYERKKSPHIPEMTYTVGVATMVYSISATTVFSNIRIIK